MRQYELMYISRADIPTEQQEAVQNRVTDLITRHGGELVNADVWGKRKLAYPIKHQSDGYYVILYFKADNTAITELNRVMSITDEILRFKILRPDAD